MKLLSGMCTSRMTYLKVPKCEIFVMISYTERSYLGRWLGDWSRKIDIWTFLGWYSLLCFFIDDWFINKKCLASTQHVVKQAGKFSKLFAVLEPSLKIICPKLCHRQKLISCGLSYRQKLFPACWAIGKKFVLHAQRSQKNLSKI